MWLNASLGYVTKLVYSELFGDSELIVSEARKADIFLGRIAVGTAELNTVAGVTCRRSRCLHLTRVKIVE